jgi:hypothetical protein
MDYEVYKHHTPTVGLKVIYVCTFVPTAGLSSQVPTCIARPCSAVIGSHVAENGMQNAKFTEGRWSTSYGQPESCLLRMEIPTNSSGCFYLEKQYVAALAKQKGVHVRGITILPRDRTFFSPTALEGQLKEYRLFLIFGLRE